MTYLSPFQIGLHRIQLSQIGPGPNLEFHNRAGTTSPGPELDFNNIILHFITLYLPTALYFDLSFNHCIFSLFSVYCVLLYSTNPAFGFQVLLINFLCTSHCGNNNFVLFWIFCVVVLVVRAVEVENHPNNPPQLRGSLRISSSNVKTFCTYAVKTSFYHNKLASQTTIERHLMIIHV